MSYLTCSQCGLSSDEVFLKPVKVGNRFVRNNTYIYCAEKKKNVPVYAAIMCGLYDDGSVQVTERDLQLDKEEIKMNVDYYLQICDEHWI